MFENHSYSNFDSNLTPLYIRKIRKLIYTMHEYEIYNAF